MNSVNFLKMYINRFIKNMGQIKDDPCNNKECSLMSKIKMKDTNKDFDEYLSNKIKQFEIEQNKLLLKLEKENEERLYNIYKDIRNYQKLNENQLAFILNLNDDDEKNKILVLFNDIIHILSDIISSNSPL